MTSAISYLIATVGIGALLALWFITTYQVISRKTQDLIHAADQVRLLRESLHQMRNGPHEASAKKMLDTSTRIYSQIEKSYNETLRNPIYRVPAFFMGYRKAEKGTIQVFESRRKSL